MLYNPLEPLIHGSNTNFQPTRNVQLWLNLHIGWKWGWLAEGALSKIGARQFSDTAKPPFSINQLKRALIARDGVKVGRAAFSATFCGNLCAGKLLRASCTNFYFTLSFQTGSHRSKQCKCQDQRSLKCLGMVSWIFVPFLKLLALKNSHGKTDICQLLLTAQILQCENGISVINYWSDKLIKILFREIISDAFPVSLPVQPAKM